MKSLLAAASAPYSRSRKACARRAKQTLGFVEPQRLRRRPRRGGEFADQHRALSGDGRLDLALRWNHQYGCRGGSTPTGERDQMLARSEADLVVIGLGRAAMAGRRRRNWDGPIGGDGRAQQRWWHLCAIRALRCLASVTARSETMSHLSVAKVSSTSRLLACVAVPLDSARTGRAVHVDDHQPLAGASAANHPAVERRPRWPGSVGVDGDQAFHRTGRSRLRRRRRRPTSAAGARTGPGCCPVKARRHGLGGLVHSACRLSRGAQTRSRPPVAVSRQCRSWRGRR